MVLHADRHVITRLQSGRSQELRQAVGIGVEFGEGSGVPRAGHDEGGLVGGRGYVCSQVHERRQ